LPAKTGSGEQRAHVTPSLDAEFRPCMPVGERADRRVTWNICPRADSVVDNVTGAAAHGLREDLGHLVHVDRAESDASLVRREAPEAVTKARDIPEQCLFEAA